ncbi:hypothetical protein OUZ56_000706 [Daphnia magna]|uniref:Uncharacterized protein n=1 Tax=Daphnia magna TaxID=35525 RepID=A0ABR0A0H6_9CRUS|nr:hypothetical protein OUZ56_000706 [Daphnia magna]
MKKVQGEVGSVVAMIGSSFRCAVSYERPTDVTNAIDVNRFTCKMKRKKTVPNKSNGLHLAPIFFSMHTAPVGLSEYYIGKKEESIGKLDSAVPALEYFISMFTVAVYKVPSSPGSSGVIENLE